MLFNIFIFEQVDKLPNGSIVYITYLDDSIFSQTPGVSLGCSIQCTQELNYSKIGGYVNWYSTSNNTKFIKNRIRYTTILEITLCMVR